MLCPMCNEALSKVAVPSYLGNVYHCDNCGQDFWYRAVKLFCPRCWKMVDAGYGLFRMDDFSIKQGKAKFADLDVFGHWHQQRDGGNFITNGSLIGYNAYALRIKADYEEPKQAFFLIDRDRGKTIVAPILVDKN